MVTVLSFPLYIVCHGKVMREQGLFMLLRLVATLRTYSTWDKDIG